MNALTEGLRGAAEMLVLGIRLLTRHWPQLLALYLAGAAGRMAFLWLTLLASKWSALLGTLILPLAPLCTLISLVVMVRVCAESLPELRSEGLEHDLDLRWKENLRIAAQVLIPFLAVYASQGLLREDAQFFIYNATAEELQNNPLHPNFERALYASGAGLAAIVLVGMVARKWISLGKLADKTVIWGLIGGYVEALWLVTLGSTLTWQLGQLKEWVISRALVDRFLQWQTAAQASENPLQKALAQVFTTLSEVLSSMGELVIFPVAWLAIGALIYGSSLITRDLPTHEQMTERLKRIPSPLLRLVAQSLEPMTTPISNTATAIGKVAAPGILKMVFYCVAFSLIGSLVKLMVAYGAHAALGPKSPNWLEAVEPYLLLLERGAYLIVSAALVAAAVSHILIVDRQEKAAQAREEQEQESAAEADTGESAEATATPAPV